MYMGQFEQYHTLALLNHTMKGEHAGLHPSLSMPHNCAGGRTFKPAAFKLHWEGHFRCSPAPCNYAEHNSILEGRWNTQVYIPHCVPSEFSLYIRPGGGWDWRCRCALHPIPLPKPDLPFYTDVPLISLKQVWVDHSCGCWSSPQGKWTNVPLT